MAGVALLVALGGQVALGPPGEASVDDGVVLDLRLDESEGARVALDSSGYGHHGSIGSHVEMNGDFADFDRHSPSEDADYDADHLILVPDAADGSLDPGTGNFTIEFRYRTTSRYGNILQKGQSRTVGGQVKFQLPRGRISCMFRTPDGMATAGSGDRVFNDGEWHDVRCERTPTSVTLYVDGERVGRKRGFTGRLDNTKPWSLGGKFDCDGERVSCDYFPGEIGWVRMTKG